MIAGGKILSYLCISPIVWVTGPGTLSMWNGIANYVHPYLLFSSIYLFDGFSRSTSRPTPFFDAGSLHRMQVPSNCHAATAVIRKKTSREPKDKMRQEQLQGRGYPTAAPGSSFILFLGGFVEWDCVKSSLNKLIWRPLFVGLPSRISSHHGPSSHPHS
jgi:hypothetical protein